jgi:hypothetical protein
MIRVSVRCLKNEEAEALSLYGDDIRVRHNTGIKKSPRGVFRNPQNLQVI